MVMVTSSKGVKALASEEGEVLESYQDVAGTWTVGIGNTSHAGPGITITKAKSRALLKKDLKIAEDAINRLVKVDLSQNMFDSLSSLVFNIGVGAFAKSTLLKKLNKGDYLGAADEFLKWRKAGGRVISGLVKRRARERAMFLDGYEVHSTDDYELESNLEPDHPLRQPVHANKPTMALAGTGTAGALMGAAESVAPLAEYSVYLQILFAILVITGIGYFIYTRKED